MSLYENKDDNVLVPVNDTGDSDIREEGCRFLTIKVSSFIL